AEDPAQRYPAASAFAADLERWLDGLPVSARDTERGYRMKRAARRHWPVLAAALAALAFLGYHLHSINDALRRVEAERAGAVAARERESRQRIEAERQRDQASALADYFAKLFEAPSTPDTVAGSMPARDLLDAGHRRLADDARMPGNVRAMLLIATADAYGHLSMPKERLDILRDTVASLERRRDTDPDVLANGQLSLAMALISQRAFAEASRAIEAGLALYDRKQAHDPNAKVELLQWRGIVATNTGDHASAREAYRRILAETAQSLHRQHAVRYRVTALANLAHSATDPEEAASLYRDALALSSSRDPDNHAMRLSLTNGLAVTLASLDRTEEAADIVETGLRDGTRLGLEASREYGILLSTAGSIDQRRGHLVRGARRLEDAHGRLRERHGATDRLVLMAAGEALLGALVIDDMAMIARLHASLAAAGAVSAQSKSRALASAYLACRHAPAAAQTAVVVERARAIAGSNALIARIDWPARCASAGKRINASGATGSAPAPRRTR
ncbi:MAG: hypothetical protein JNM58_15105, partial [Xanthomonadaceae bacterium]|nr:hypothetical protein [Xanthomonadaceae bacterium]